MTNDASAPAAAAARTPSAQDYAIARLNHQRGQLETLIDQLNARVAELESEKAALADRLAEVLAESAVPASPTVEVEDQVNG